MKKDYQVLYYIQKNGYSNQRLLSKESGYSLGFINGALRRLQESGLLRKSGRDVNLTAKGTAVLESFLKDGQAQKLIAGKGASKVQQAVILAAGYNVSFDDPVGMLLIERESLIQRIVRILRQVGIERICVVTGFKSRELEKHLRSGDIKYVCNSSYIRTGTMASLACAESWIKGDFIIVESNQIFQEEAIERAIQYPEANVMLMANPSGSMDEAYVELDQENNIFRVSKDIRQMNKIDGELIGISKLSYELFQRMMKYYSHNQNPMINYEYVMESLGRTYRIPGVIIDDLQWAVIENQQHYKRVSSWLISRISKKDNLLRESKAKEIFADCMKICQEEIIEIRPGGGMTNRNFYVRTKDGEYILRIPGAGTDKMINRDQEMNNSKLGEKIGINVPCIYFNGRSGVKITKYIPQARTLNGKTARLELSIRKTVEVLKRLHGADITMDNNFAAFQQYEDYKRQAKALNVSYYSGFTEMDRWMAHMRRRLEEIGENVIPCHNDLVPENFIEDKEGRRYLIDWEYAGMNDPMWDLAAHILECEFDQEDERFFLQCYFDGEPAEDDLEKIAIYKMCQDILWSIWTVIKEAKGEEFGTYGRDRLKRAGENRRKYENKYGK